MVQGSVVMDSCPILAGAVAKVLSDRLNVDECALVRPEDGLPTDKDGARLLVFDPSQVASLPDLLRVSRRLEGWRRLAFCSRPSVELARFCMDQGCHGFLPKTAKEDLFVHAVRVLLEGASYIDRSYGRRLMTANAARSTGNDLSEREEQILRLIARGHSAQVVAERLSLSAKTIDTYRARGMEKLQLADRPALIKAALARGWLG